MLKAWAAAIALGAVGGLTLASCDRQGPAERAGEKIDHATEDAQDSMAKAGDKVGDAMHDAGDKIKEGAEDAHDSLTTPPPEKKP
jgi:hypothetical protein